MKIPRKGVNRLDKNLNSEKTANDALLAKKPAPIKSKLPTADWKRRWFLSLTAASAIAFPAFAQTPATSPAISPPPIAAQQSATSAEDIHDIRGPISIPYEWLWAAYLAGGVAAAAASYAAWRYFRNRARERAKLDFEIALEKLEAARQLMAENRVREYAFTVSEIIRVYIEQRFDARAARRTTEEFLSDLVQQTDTPLGLHRRRLEDFLSHCDLMKFARWEASTSELESMHESARVFITETRPQPETKKSAPVAAKASSPAQPELAQVK